MFNLVDTYYIMHNDDTQARCNRANRVCIPRLDHTYLVHYAYAYNTRRDRVLRLVQMYSRDRNRRTCLVEIYNVYYT